MNEATASLVRIIEGYEIQIFLGNIILRYLMSANFPLISAPSVFYARHYVSF
jgi:hypothetical protein